MPREEALPSGVRTKDTRIGNGAEATAGSVVRIRYKGSLEDGTVFDETDAEQPPVQFILVTGPGGVIPGFMQGIIGMRAGGERTIQIPWRLGYGDRPQAGIPARSDLTFEVKLVHVF